jgi:isopenicillin N synthase-like dioxygenase
LRVVTTARAVPVIDLSDFEARRDEITERRWRAATEVGFFQLHDHGIKVAPAQRGVLLHPQRIEEQML